MTGIELCWNIFFNMFLAYSSYSKLVYDVTTDHMTLRFEIFWSETTNWQEGNGQDWYGIICNLAESTCITTGLWVKLCIGHSRVYRGQYREVKSKDRFFVCY